MITTTPHPNAINVYIGGRDFPALMLSASRDFEAPHPFHSLGGGAGVPKHDRAAHASGRPHICTQVRTGRQHRATLRAETWEALEHDSLTYYICPHDLARVRAALAG